MFCPARVETPHVRHIWFNKLFSPTHGSKVEFCLRKSEIFAVSRTFNKLNTKNIIFPENARDDLGRWGTQVGGPGERGYWAEGPLAKRRP